MPFSLRLLFSFALLVLVALRPVTSAAASPSKGEVIQRGNVEPVRRALRGMEDLVRRSTRKLEGRSEGIKAKNGDEVRMKKKQKKRCYYIGTFFRRIDCNAPVNSTKIPYAPPQASATGA
ncbi:hypothetical protein JCM11641_003928 [Rhodosporidiobolus odoratus]